MSQVKINVDRNFSEVILGKLTIWFSYKTPIGFQIVGEPRVVRQNDWASTTGRHLKLISPSKQDRISGEEFVIALDDVIEKHGLAFH